MSKLEKQIESYLENLVKTANQISSQKQGNDQIEIFLKESMLNTGIELSVKLALTYDVSNIDHKNISNIIEERTKKYQKYMLHYNNNNNISNIEIAMVSIMIKFFINTTTNTWSKIKKFIKIENIPKNTFDIKGICEINTHMPSYIPYEKQLDKLIKIAKRCAEDITEHYVQILLNSLAAYSYDYEINKIGKANHDEKFNCKENTAKSMDFNFINKIIEIIGKWGVCDTCAMILSPNTYRNLRETRWNDQLINFIKNNQLTLITIPDMKTGGLIPTGIINSYVLSPMSVMMILEENNFFPNYQDNFFKIKFNVEAKIGSNYTNNKHILKIQSKA